jgi:hypothetical protein
MTVDIEQISEIIGGTLVGWLVAGLTVSPRILGSGWDAGCADPPEWWGAERPWFIVNLTDSSNVEIACLEITDRSGCIEFHPHAGLACEREASPYGDWASYGLQAEDSANVYLHDLNIHGLAAGGVHAGRLTDWTGERLAGPHRSGWLLR